MRIQILPREITEKIAAGEVVERPASVIKELLENSLDAQATRVEVTAWPAMTDRLEVSDDGTGMSPEEVRVALMRHATSKITCEEDLYSISSLGFRGEALASIAAVADLRIETRTEDTDLGVRVRVQGGEVSEVREVGMTRGTRIVVQDLFQYTPARLKFLRSRQTEAGHILDTFLRLSLSRKDVTFHLKKKDKSWIQAPATADLKQRAAHLFGWELAERLKPLSGEDGDCRLHGLVGPADMHRGNQRGLFLFVNRRPIRDVMVLRAIHEAYRGNLPKGRVPVAILFLDLPFSDVDVNAHPTKMEVHFSHPQEIRALFVRHVSRALERNAWFPVPGPSGGSVEKPLIRDPSDASAVSYSPGPLPDKSPVSDPPRPPDSARHPRPAPPASPGEPEPVSPVPPPRPDPLFTRFRILGQLQDTYLVCEYGEQLLLVDQHAAHERIVYEQLEDAYDRQGIVKQSLLIPSVVELPPREAECVREQREPLSAFGLEVEPYGGMSFVVKAVPAVLADADPGRLLQDVAEELVEQGRTHHLNRMRSQVFARMACHTVVRAGRTLEPREMDALLRALDEKPGLLSCPHGRPVVIAWSLQEIQKRFRRI